MLADAPARQPTCSRVPDDEKINKGDRFGAIVVGQRGWSEQQKGRLGVELAVVPPFLASRCRCRWCWPGWCVGFGGGYSACEPQPEAYCEVATSPEHNVGTGSMTRCSRSDVQTTPRNRQDCIRGCSGQGSNRSAAHDHRSRDVAVPCTPQGNGQNNTVRGASLQRINVLPRPVPCPISRFHRRRASRRPVSFNALPTTTSTQRHKAIHRQTRSAQPCLLSPRSPAVASMAPPTLTSVRFVEFLISCGALTRGCSQDGCHDGRKYEPP